MILRRSTMLSLSGAQIRLFCRAKPVISSRFFIKNDNLVFEDGNYKMTPYFFLPELKKSQGSTYSINKFSNVLSLVWEAKGSDGEIKKGAGDQAKMSFSFRYHELQSLLAVLPKSGASTTIEHSKNSSLNSTAQILTTLTLTDNPQRRLIHYNWSSNNTSIADASKAKSTLHFEFGYSHHRIFEILLRRSLFELSGMGIIYELRRWQEINSSENQNIQNMYQIEKETAEFFKE